MLKIEVTRDLIELFLKITNTTLVKVLSYSTLISYMQIHSKLKSLECIPDFSKNRVGLRMKTCPAICKITPVC